jgi:hypothetical protein
MRKLILAVGLVLTVNAPAADRRVETMTKNCISAMDSGLCRIALDPKDYPKAEIPVVLPTGKRMIKTHIYLALRATGFAKDAQGNWLMCKKVIGSCGQNGEFWDSDACLAVRTMGWRY